MAGHSIGEYVAACVAGILDLEDALEIVVARAQATEELCEAKLDPESESGSPLHSGSMMSVRAEAALVEEYVGEYHRQQQEELREAGAKEADKEDVLALAAAIRAHYA